MQPQSALDLLGKEKSFHHPWIGHPLLNRLGLHPARILASDLLFDLRVRRLPRARKDAAILRALKRDGVVALEGFVPEDEHKALRAEAYELLALTERAVPLPQGGADGFGEKQPFQGGFDRFDGSSLNRFLAITPKTLPRCARLVTSRRTQTLLQAASGMEPKRKAFMLQYLRQGDDRDHHDIQKELHRDTFHRAFKLWYFFDPVRADDGPFEYVLGSHRADRARLRWEYERSLRARTLDAESHKGSFRAHVEELGALGLSPPKSFTVPGNTLLIADVRGFHRRGIARPGIARVAIHASLRPEPFSLPEVRAEK